jgi:hypothetical protein
MEPETGIEPALISLQKRYITNLCYSGTMAPHLGIEPSKLSLEDSVARPAHGACFYTEILPLGIVFAVVIPAL